MRRTASLAIGDSPVSPGTLVVSAVPNNRICVTRRAVPGLHAARLIDRHGQLHADPDASQIMYETYPAAVRDWIRRHGGLTCRLLILRGHDLAGLFRVCR